MSRSSWRTAVVVPVIAVAMGVPARAADEDGCRPCEQGCALVKQHGRAAGGAVDVEWVVELNMRGWKPQSSRGIEVLGWAAVERADGRCTVSYAYREQRQEPVSLVWDVDLRRATIAPRSPLTERVQRMAEILAGYGVGARAVRTDSVPDGSEPPAMR